MNSPVKRKTVSASINSVEDRRIYVFLQNNPLISPSNLVKASINCYLDSIGFYIDDEAPKQEKTVAKSSFYENKKEPVVIKQESKVIEQESKVIEQESKVVKQEPKVEKTITKEPIIEGKINVDEDYEDYEDDDNFDDDFGGDIEIDEEDLSISDNESKVLNSFIENNKNK